MASRVSNIRPAPDRVLVDKFFNDGTRTENVAVESPIGHRRRRKEGIPVHEYVDWFVEMI